MTKTIGILGGMGPKATVDLFEKIISNTPVKADQDHFRILIDNNPKIPSRVDAFANKQSDPLPALIQSALTLERAGADFIVMPCHTAHIWIDQLQKSVSIPFYSMIENTVSYIIENQINTQKMIIFATPTTIEKQLYQKLFQKNDLHFILPSMSEQQIIYDSILKVKSGYIEDNPYIDTVNEILCSYKKQGVTTLLAACTEIPLLYPFLSKDIEMLDPTLMLAKLAIQKGLEQ